MSTPGTSGYRLSYKRVLRALPINPSDRVSFKGRGRGKGKAAARGQFGPPPNWGRRGLRVCHWPTLSRILKGELKERQKINSGSLASRKRSENIDFRFEPKSGPVPAFFVQCFVRETKLFWAFHAHSVPTVRHVYADKRTARTPVFAFTFIHVAVHPLGASAQC